MAKTGRNDACPCGSGKKYKNCHLGQPMEVVGDTIAPPLDPRQRRARAMIPTLAFVLVLGGLGAWWKAGQGLAIGAAIGLFLGIGLVLMRDPPPPSDSGSGSAINFGN